MKFVQTGRAERRRDTRLGNHVLTLELEGQFYSTTDWSLGGFGLDGYQGSLQPGTLVPVTFVLETGHQKLAAKFDKLGRDAYDLLDGWQAGRLQEQDAQKFA